MGDEHPDDRSPKERPDATSAFTGSMRQAGPYFGLGIELAVSMVFFVLVGYFADRWLGTSPWLLMLGIALSAVATGFTLWRVVREANRASAAQSAARKEQKAKAQDGNDGPGSGRSPSS